MSAGRPRASPEPVHQVDPMHIERDRTNMRTTLGPSGNTDPSSHGARGVFLVTSRSRGHTHSGPDAPVPASGADGAPARPAVPIRATRSITALGHDCTVVAPSLVPVRAGNRVKTNRRDAVTLARLHRAGELTGVWVPDPVHEAMRDLVRARTAAMEAVRRARQQLQGFLLRHGRVFTGRKTWSPAHRRWLAGLRFEHPAQQVVLQEQLDVIDEAERRRDRLEGQIRELVPGWSLAPVVAALQAMRGVALLSAVVLAAEVGDFRRFATPRQLAAWLGLVPSEHSSGSKVERGGITKAGNGRARRVLVGGAWSYRFPAPVTGELRARLEGVPERVRAIAWRAQLRLCARYRRLVASGKNAKLVTAAIAREMAGFAWAMAREAQPAGAAA